MVGEEAWYRKRPEPVPLEEDRMKLLFSLLLMRQER